LKHDEDALVKGIYRCECFRDAVLPNDPELIQLLHDRDTAKHNRISICDTCKERFIPNSNRQRFCTLCGITNRRQHKTQSERNRRNARQTKSI
jgi:hypothetical protein